jgi:MFS family permease
VVFASLLACLVAAGVGWSIVNPAIGRAIIELFPANERGLAMGIKQMGLTVGGVASALALPQLAAQQGWRVALALCAVVALIPVAVSWRPMRSLAKPVPDHSGAPPAPSSPWWWVGRPPLVLLFAAGLGLGMTQSAVLGYLPLFGTQGLHLTRGGWPSPPRRWCHRRAWPGLRERCWPERAHPWLVATRWSAPPPSSSRGQDIVGRRPGRGL